MKFKISLALAVLLIYENTWARAGGAGGGHSGGGGGFHGGGGGYSGGGFSSTTTYGGGSGDSGGLGGVIFFFIFFITVILILKKMFGNQEGSVGPTRSVPPGGVDYRIPADMSALGGESPTVLESKARIAFLTIQHSWSEQRLDLMRKFITDGIYQRFNAQFTMMRLLEQQNPISDIQITDVRIVKTTLDGGYQCADVRIQAGATDKFTCGKFPQLDSPGGYEEFVEYWSFIRRQDHKRGTDLFQSETCPQCSAALTGKLLETARCPYCSTYLNSGEFDWVLSEITQEVDYGGNFRDQYRLPPLLAMPSEIIHQAFPSFSRQVLEDRASNAFMQILIASATRNTQVLQKFTTAEAYQKLSSHLPAGHIVYDRLYTQSVDLITVQSEGNRLKAYIGIKYSSHQVILERGAENFIGEHEPVPLMAVLVMIRELSAITAKGSVYAGACPHCGAPQKDSLSAVCEYCSGSLNDPRVDWVVEDLIDMARFRGHTELFVSL